MNHIELFAGCGGLSLGLESEGFELLLANELSPMAAETYAYNLLGLDLSKTELPVHRRLYWISSNFSKHEINKRLRENPTEAAGLINKFNDLSDMTDFNNDLLKSLLVGSINDLNVLLQSNINLKNCIKSGLGKGVVDLVSGGPPCQSFSLAGLRQLNNNRNKLPWEFAKFVNHVQPRMALLENVSGILHAFNDGADKFYAWFEVAKAFAEINYIPLCLHVNAKYVGAAQNRPRFILLAFRDDEFKRIKNSLKNSLLLDALEKSEDFVIKFRAGSCTHVSDLKYYDVDKETKFFENEILSPLISSKSSRMVSTFDAIDDLRNQNLKKSSYVKHINSCFGKGNSKTYELMNHEYRANSERVKSRFRLYQILSVMNDSMMVKEIKSFVRDPENQVLSDITLNKLILYSFWRDGKEHKFSDITQLKYFIKTLHTKKQTQKALIADKPAPAALSIPDDACHYHEDELRTLTVREMARIQSFPDWFTFRSKITTGGQMRKFEVPQYTQVGNAVPPLLGKALAKVCNNFLNL